MASDLCGRCAESAGKPAIAGPGRGGSGPIARAFGWSSTSDTSLNRTQDTRRRDRDASPSRALLSVYKSDVRCEKV